MKNRNRHVQLQHSGEIMFHFCFCQRKSATLIPCCFQDDLCKICNMEEPPNKTKRINWICCDACDAWFHQSCLNMKRKPRKGKEFKCAACIEQSQWRVIPVEGDGRCFFRSIATAENPCLQNAERDVHGRIGSFHLRLQETNRADELRQETITYMVHHLQEYSHLGEGVNSDMPRNDHYNSVEERIMAMREPTTMPGEIEISAIAKACSIRIVVHASSQVVYGQQFDKVVHVKYTQLRPAVGHYECMIAK